MSEQQNKGIEDKHEVPEGHKYYQKCGKEYGVDYFEGDVCGVSSNNPFSLSEREVPGYKIVGASTSSPLTMEERLKKFFFDNFDNPKTGETHRWIFCVDTPEQIKNNDIYDCACCLNYEKYKEGCQCRCHERIQQISDFIRSEISSAVSQALKEQREKIKALRKTPLGTDNNGTELYITGSGELKYNQVIDEVLGLLSNNKE